MNIVTILKIAGHLFVLGVVVYSFAVLLLNAFRAIRERNWKWLAITLLIMLICTLILVFIFKKHNLVESLVNLF